MSKRGLHVVPFLLLCLVGATGCVVNKAIPANAIADNLAVEKAQNEMLLLNVLRGKDHSPMYVTGISKITGSIKAEASLNATVPFGSIGRDPNAAKSSTYYIASPTATYNWNPSFDVNVFDTSEFMHGFLTPVSGDIFAYYWNLGFYPQVLFHLMVRKAEVKIKYGVCNKTPGDRRVEEYIFFNNHERGETLPRELERFGEWVDFFLENHPRFGEGKSESLGPKISEVEAQRALVKGLKEGLTLAPVGNQFQFERLGSSKQILILDGGSDTLKSILSWTKGYAREEAYPHVEPSSEADAEGCSPDDAAVQSGSYPGRFTQSDLVDGNRITITLFLRSPEAILYYLGEMARIEEKQKNAVYFCLDGLLEPLFVVRHSGECDKQLVQVTNGNGEAYSIPAPDDDMRMPCNGTKTVWLEVSCDPGRSMEALTVISQLIALQKSAKDLPTTSVVRVVGQ